MKLCENSGCCWFSPHHVCGHTNTKWRPLCKVSTGPLFTVTSHEHRVSQIIGNSTVVSTACLGQQHEKHLSSAWLALYEGNPPVTGGFPSQRASHAESIFMRWRHHGHSSSSIFSQLPARPAVRPWICAPPAPHTAGRWGTHEAAGHRLYKWSCDHTPAAHSQS